MNCPTTEKTTQLRGPVPLSHLFIRQFVREGDQVVDATCGTGNDTLLLAQLAGPTGRVRAFDIQQAAIAATTARLTEAGCLDHVELINGGHETIAEKCPGPVRAVVFNLGYLPGGDRTMITRPETTLAAVEQALEILAPGGIVAITLYPGHDGGSEEQSALEAMADRLNPRSFHTWHMRQTNVPPTAPGFMLIQKAA